MCIILFYIFFFQAEDGIRDGRVTGVQTCALPISGLRNTRVKIDQRLSDAFWNSLTRVLRNPAWQRRSQSKSLRFPPRCGLRSEERRVGKECRSGWLAYH